MQEWRYALKEGSRKGGMQERRYLEKLEMRMQERMMQDRRDAGKEGYGNERR